MILIGRGLDLERECERMSKERRKPSWSDGGRSFDLCGFEGARIQRKRREEAGRPLFGRTGVRGSAAAKGSKPCLVSGDNSLRDPPVPIPNTEVKPQHADSTWLETAR